MLLRDFGLIWNFIFHTDLLNPSKLFQIFWNPCLNIESCSTFKMLKIGGIVGLETESRFYHTVLYVSCLPPSYCCIPLSSTFWLDWAEILRSKYESLNSLYFLKSEAHYYRKFFLYNVAEYGSCHRSVLMQSWICWECSVCAAIEFGGGLSKCWPWNFA
jgi:hypothetical protein